ncbi:MAG TPA: hypothetical protein VGX22_04740 [Candidatus Dormibacteraeota bacterium]|nr:hypothetical protein [Candidatus Dormibacteraeota bacterium]
MSNQSFVPTSRALLRLGAIAGVAGIALQFLAESQHPGRSDPNNSAVSFQAYSQSSIWQAVHMADFFAFLLIALAILVLALSLSIGAGLSSALGVVASNTIVMVAVVFAVQMAVDGVALKHAIDMWVAAAPPDKAAAFMVADGIRGVEKGLSAFFLLLDGITLLTVGAAVALAQAYARWLGLLGMVGGICFIAGGVATAYTGFSPQAQIFLNPGFVAAALFLIGACVSMWRKSGEPRSQVEAAPLQSVA